MTIMWAPSAEVSYAEEKNKLGANGQIPKLKTLDCWLQIF